MEVQIICDRKCGFRVHRDYFHQKQKFDHTSCPRCGGPLKIVDEGTDSKAAGASWDGRRVKVA